MPRNSKDNSLERYNTMMSLCEKYHIYLSYPHARLTMRSETKARVKSAIHFVKVFKCTLAKLEPKYIEIIKNEFLSDDKNYWWKLKYSRATFYRYRDKAVTNFLAEFSL